MQSSYYIDTEKYREDFDTNTGKVVMRFLDMCITSCREAATGEYIFSKMDIIFTAHNVPWVNCVGVVTLNSSSVWQT